MKIAIPVDEKSIKSSLCLSFGRAPYFLVFDMDTKESIFLDNSAATSQGGAGIKAAQTIVDNDVKALFTHRCGENAAEVIKAANIKIFKIAFDSIQANIDAFVEGKLPLLEEIHAGFHGHGGK